MKLMPSHFIGIILIAIIVPLILRALARSVTKPKGGHKQGVKHYQIFVYTYSLLLISLSFLLSQFMSGLLVQLNSGLNAKLSDNDIFLILPEKAVWFIPSLILSVLLVGVILNEVAKHTLSNYKELVAENRRRGRNIPTKTFWYFSGVVLFFLAFVFLALFNWKVEIQTNSIDVKYLTDIKTAHYNFSDVVNIEQVNKLNKQGQLINTEYVVHFTDNREWNTAYGLEDTAKQSEILKYVAKKSGVEMTIRTIGQ